MAMNLEMSLIKMWLQNVNYLFNGQCAKYHNNRPNNSQFELFDTTLYQIGII